MQRNCDTCGNIYIAKTSRSKYCCDNCRKRAQHMPARPRTVKPVTGKVVNAVRAELETADRLDTPLGCMAMRLAERMCGNETGSSMASLSRELRATMAEALKDARTAADPVDDLRARRDVKRAG